MFALICCIDVLYGCLFFVLVSVLFAVVHFGCRFHMLISYFGSGVDFMFDFRLDFRLDAEKQLFFCCDGSGRGRGRGGRRDEEEEEEEEEEEKQSTGECRPDIGSSISFRIIAEISK